VVGLLMVALAVLAVTGMVSSMVIAQINQGMAAAVNQSGTLRMQSYRVGVALADDRPASDERRRRVADLAAEFEQRLTSPRLTGALPRAAADPVRLAYERVRWRWVHEMRRALDAFAASPPDSTDAVAARTAYLGGVDDFVDDIHGLVRVLEERTERRIDLLRLIQTVALVLTLAIVLVTMIVVQRRVVMPLGELLDCADRARRGDFSARTRFAGGDELGRLGAAMNLMTQGLYQIYNELEERVAAKTRDLARSNHSLELLYRTSRTLNASPVSEPVLRHVLADVRDQLRLGAVVLCLRQDTDLPGSACIGADAGRDGAGCPDPACRLCDGAALAISVAGPDAAADASGDVLSVPVADKARRFGMLRVLPRPGRPLADWQRPLLESVAGQMATALNLQSRMRESRRLILHEERSILARELHDSLAQSLSYLKIQAARLDAALNADDAPRSGAPAEVLAEMRAGINSAYRQLRELLTTFRLKMDGRGLTDALADTVQEFRDRSDLAIVLDDRLPAGLLSANEEVHVLQIAREALSNVVRHARAHACRVDARLDDGDVEVAIADDGTGLPAAPAGRGHYGMTIMRERTLSLGGSIELDSPVGGGLRIRVRFRPRGLADRAVETAQQRFVGGRSGAGLEDA
jgi:two-component system nitrate/nitrite sensor histidine kinase NarX